MSRALVAHSSSSKLRQEPYVPADEILFPSILNMRAEPAMKIERVKHEYGIVRSEFSHPRMTKRNEAERRQTRQNEAEKNRSRRLDVDRVWNRSRSDRFRSAPTVYSRNQAEKDRTGEDLRGRGRNEPERCRIRRNHQERHGIRGVRGGGGRCCGLSCGLLTEAVIHKTGS